MRKTKSIPIPPLVLKKRLANEGKWVLEKMDLSGMQSWSDELQSKARDLLCSYSDIFSKHDLDMGRTGFDQA